MTIMRVSEKGWVVIPKELRERLGILPGATVEVTEDDGRVIVTLIPRDPADAGYGLLAGYGLTDALLESRQEDCAAEDRGMGSTGHERARGAATAPAGPPRVRRATPRP